MASRLDRVTKELVGTASSHNTTARIISREENLRHAKEQCSRQSNASHGPVAWLILQCACSGIGV
jgi:hypothetical protein